jgi:hypothetical protein
MLVTVLLKIQVVLNLTPLQAVNISDVSKTLL